MRVTTLQLLARLGRTMYTIRTTVIKKLKGLDLAGTVQDIQSVTLRIAYLSKKRIY